MNVAPITYLSLFAGVDALGLGFELAFPEARCIGRCEIEVAASEIMAARVAEGSLAEAPQWSDIRTFPAAMYRGRTRAIVAGFPCPDYSVAGKRAGRIGKHGQLWDYLRDTIRDVGPELVLLENVPGILVCHESEEPGHVLPAGLWFVLGDLADMGFAAEWGCVSASDVGASHKRSRWFVLAYRKSGGFGELRKPSRRGGFTHGSSAAMGDAEYAIRWPEHEEHSNTHRRDGSGWAGTDVGNPDQPRLEGRSQCRCGLPNERAAGAAGVAGFLANGDIAGCGIERGGGIFDGERQAQRNNSDECNQDLADAALLRRSECGPVALPKQRPKAVLAGARRTSPWGDDVASASLAGLETRNSHSLRNVTRDREGLASCCSGESLPIFAPGPGEHEQWRGILAEYPYLAPALSKEEAESTLRELAPRLADLVDLHRTDSLRAAGNGVVALQAGFAARVLAERAGLTSVTTEKQCKVCVESFSRKLKLRERKAKAEVGL